MHVLAAGLWICESTSPFKEGCICGRGWLHCTASINSATHYEPVSLTNDEGQVAIQAGLYNAYETTVV
jgi:hypothetical protein